MIIVILEYIKHLRDSDFSKRSKSGGCHFKSLTHGLYNLRIVKAQSKRPNHHKQTQTQKQRKLKPQN